MPPKEKLKVKKNSLKKNHLKKSRVILPHMVTQVAQQMPPLGKTNEMHQFDPVVQPIVSPLKLDVNSTTLAPQSARPQVEMPPLGQTNEMHQSDPVIRMMPTPDFVPHNTVHPSRQDHISPAPTTNHSPSQPLTSVSSRHTSLSANLPPPIPVGSGDRTQGSR
ncbi:hypothetical protein L195_g050979 [Trifolium pratense]|uniref:Uncharacterized protein n=1 Tax=Trifolium pratense TaxID=57577 RepID=A0A2K3JWZ1_TRIPR|nr:hypothetical protein L195_g050979 [Trifolium pratense]